MKQDWDVLIRVDIFTHSPFNSGKENSKQMTLEQGKPGFISGYLSLGKLCIFLSFSFLIYDTYFVELL